MTNDDTTAVPAFRKRARSANLRQKTVPESAGGGGPASEAVAAATTVGGAGLAAGGNDRDGGGGDDDDGTRVVRKERRLNPSPFVQGTGTAKAAAETSTPTLEQAFQSRRTAGSSIAADENATATLDVDTEADRDAEARLQRQLQITKDLEAKGLIDDKTYRGQSGYTLFIKKQDAEHGAKYRPGPQRASSNIRTTIRYDYQPDVCKDYKETGFCGYGDSCKFVHDRGDYKSGWQLDREWDQKTYGQGDPSEFEIKEDDNKEDDNLPFACFVCRGDFKNPVVTKCQHYFCEKCAMDHFRKSPKCAACGAPTHGIFNMAKILIKKLEQRRHDGAGSSAPEPATTTAPAAAIATASASS